MRLTSAWDLELSRNILEWWWAGWHGQFVVLGRVWHAQLVPWVACNAVNREAALRLLVCE